MSIHSERLSLAAALALFVLAGPAAVHGAPAATPAPAPKPAAASTRPAAKPATSPVNYSPGTVTATPAPGKALPPAAAVSKAPVTPPTPAAPARATARRAPAARPATAADSVMKLKGGQEGTAFRTLTIEGEDRIRMSYDRPVLDLDLDPEQADGLGLGSARDLLERTAPDPGAALLSLTAREPSPYLAHPWLGRIASGAVARFRPDIKGAERWTLTVADSRGGPVASFEGRGDPPAEIVWDGRTRDGSPARPGLTYSYVLQARDRAGNKRNFVGEGFKIPAYRLASPTGMLLMIPGEEFGVTSVRTPGASPAAPALVTLEAASWLNRLPTASARIQVSAVARTQERASALAAGVARDLSRLVLGDPARVTGSGSVEPDAPESGIVRIETVR